MPSFEPRPIIRAATSEFVAQPLGPVRDSTFVPEPLGRPAGTSEPASVAAGQPSEVEAVDLEAIRREGYEEGLTAGRAELPCDDVDALRSAIGALNESAAALGSLRKTYLHTHRRAIADLAIAIASKLVVQKVENDPDVLAGIVARALELIDPPAGASLRLAAADYAVLEAGNAPELERLRSEHQLVVESDADLQVGDVRVRAGMVEVDARLAELLRRIREQLCEVLDVTEQAE